MAVLIDTSVIYALIDRDERRHGACVEAVAAEREAIIIPAPVLPEITYLINRRHGSAAELAFLRGMLESDWAVEPMRDVDVVRAIDLLERFSDADIGFVDASLVAMAERMAISRIYTLDRRDFGLVRPAHVDAFELLP